MMESLRTYNDILCIDLKNFFASVECADRNLDPFKTPLVVADAKRGGHSIVLAISPFLKAQGMPSRFRLQKLPRKYNTIVAQPRMALYVKYSYEVINIYLKYISFEDLYVYSVDEAFLDVTKYKKLYKTDAKGIAKMIMDDIYNSLGLYSACGIGPNMLLAKFALDLHAKKMPDSIAQWQYDELAEKLWPISNLTSVWSIGPKTAQKLNMMGIFTMKDLAFSDVNKLKKHFGLRGEELYLHAHGIDVSRIQDKAQLFSDPKSYGINQTVYKLCSFDDVLVILFEQAQKLAARLRKNHQTCRGVSIMIKFSYQEGRPIFMKRQLLATPTSSEHMIFKLLKTLFLQNAGQESKYRSIGCSVYGLENQEHLQLSLLEQNLDKDYDLQVAIDAIKEKYGANSALYASALKENATIKERNKLIGGHNAK